VKTKIFASLYDDAHQGWVWLDAQNLPARSVVKITNPASGKSIYCEALPIDRNFLKRYNQAPRISITEPSLSLVINGWYRAKLGGISTQSSLELVIKPRNCWLGRFLACADHPQIVVRVSAWLGAIGLALGILGLAPNCFK